MRRTTVRRMNQCRIFKVMVTKSCQKPHLMIFIKQSESSALRKLTSPSCGPFELLFSVDSTEDPAYYVVCRLLLDFKFGVDARLIVAGPSTTCRHVVIKFIISRFADS